MPPMSPGSEDVVVIAVKRWNFRLLVLESP